MKKIRVLFGFGVAVFMAALLALSLFSAPASANATGDQDQVEISTSASANAAGDEDSIDIGTAAQAQRFTWKKFDYDGCTKARTITVYLRSRPHTGYLTAETKLRVRIERDGQVFTRKIGLLFGDGDLVWQFIVAKDAEVRWAKAVASWQGRAPVKGSYVYCGVRS